MTSADPLDHREIGRQAEDRCAEFLIQQGITIITRRFSSRGGEIDIIGLEGDQLIFFEVKDRSREGVAESAITSQKFSRLQRAGQAYLHQIGEPHRSHRFELLASSPSGIKRYSFEADFIEKGAPDGAADPEE